MYLHFLFCLPKSFFFWSAGSFFAPEPPVFAPRGWRHTGWASISAQHALEASSMQCSAAVCARGIAQPLVLRDFLWGISIVSLAPHSLGHPSLRIPSAGWLGGGRGHIVLYSIPLPPLLLFVREIFICPWSSGEKVAIT